ncbi:MAG: toxin-antitoxin system HicB family antitoxin [Magnetococcales bacterium]|nr:toxin-antitoxin system HicB family antitoxin [Magnetococcales bacterium]MBF0263267.1 toxin-antitoxin system HicB family antitoxin [Magnetococcales bacterium]
MRNLEDYPFEIRPLSPDEGSGYLISFTDFNECISDGESVEEAIANGMDALKGMIETLDELGMPVPAPLSGGYSGKFVARVPKTLHARLVSRARREGVSLNALVTALLAEGVGAGKTDGALSRPSMS